MAKFILIGFIGAVVVLGFMLFRSVSSPSTSDTGAPRSQADDAADLLTAQKPKTGFFVDGAVIFSGEKVVTNFATAEQGNSLVLFGNFTGSENAQFVALKQLTDLSTAGVLPTGSQRTPASIAQRSATMIELTLPNVHGNWSLEINEVPVVIDFTGRFRESLGNVANPLQGYANIFFNTNEKGAGSSIATATSIVKTEPLVLSAGGEVTFWGAFPPGAEARIGGTKDSAYKAFDSFQKISVTSRTMTMLKARIPENQPVGEYQIVVYHPNSPTAAYGPVSYITVR